jgi:four helix bundle protein
VSKFECLEVAHEMDDRFAEMILPALAQRSPKIADEADRAAGSVVNNIAEGRSRTGKDRLHCFRLAAGSGEELRTCLRRARSRRYLPDEAFEPTLDLLDRVMAMLWRLCGR